MEIEVRSEGPVAVAAVSGDIDGKTAPAAQAQLLPVVEQSPQVVLEMSGVRFLSSAGLRMMLLVYRHATAREGKVVLVGLSEEIQDTMDMTGFLGFFTLADTLEEGLAHIEGA
ncbi:MAG: anti-sigma factor antagonist [Armatimonadia bacterium]|nr:anti-sigma factor antagonist [Armatimonadia bacterium]